MLAKEPRTLSTRVESRRRPILLGVALLALLALALASQASWAAPSEEAPRQTITTQVDGHVTLQGRSACPNASWVVTLHVALYSDENPSTPYLTQDVTTDTCGDFVIPSVGVGTNNIVVKGTHTLSLRKNNVWANDVRYGAATYVDFGTLLEGDASDDNNVNAIDSAIMATSYWKRSTAADFDGRADFNEDDYIDARDASLLATNYWRTGSTLLSTATTTPQTLPEGADIAFSPLTAQVAPGDIFTLTVTVATHGNDVQAADVFIQFNPALLQVVDDDGQPTDTVKPIYDSLNMVLANRVDNANGIIAYAAMEITPYVPTDTLRLFDIPLRACAPSGAEGTALTFLFDQDNGRVTLLTQEGYDIIQNNYPATIDITSPFMLVLPQMYQQQLVIE